MPADGSAVTLSGLLPEGLAVQKVAFFWSGLPAEFGGKEFDLAAAGLCTTSHVATGTKVQCSIATNEFGLPAVAPDDELRMIVYVSVEGPGSSAGSFASQFSVGGGGAPSMTASDETLNSTTSPSFGTTNFDFFDAAADGQRDLQAGDHPYELTTTIDLASELRTGPEGNVKVTSAEDLKDVVVDLPLGFAGSTLAAPQCTLTQLSGQACPRDTIVGHLLTEPRGLASVNGPIYNVTPERGYAGEFGYIDALRGSHVFYVQVVPSPAGYVLQVTNKDIPQVSLARIVATFYGEPAVRDQTGNAAVPFFTNPTGCASGPMVATIHMDSWQNPAQFNPDGTPDLNGPGWVSKVSEAAPVNGCNLLSFAPEIKAQPTTTTADTPTGLEFEMKLPQTETAGVLATPALKTATVRLPAGVTVDPSAGGGLDACSVAQIGWLGGTPFNFTPAQPRCPEASKIGSLELTTPLIAGTLTGAMYLARQNENPFGSVLAAYVVVDDPVTGVLLKIPGELKADPGTGQLTAVFAENPQLPFSDLKLHFFGGPRAELATADSCGTFTTTGDLEPWSALDPSLDPIASDSFTIGEGCVGAFAPGFEAGATNLQAGAYTPFVASFTRSDTDQELAGLSVTLPAGLLAKINGVPQCPDAQAAAGTCPEASRVGSVEVQAGPGPNPLAVAGKVYLTGPYNGGPYGLVVVTPAIAGPFDFGTVVVRQSLRIDPRTARVTDVSDPFPTILDPQGANGQQDGIPIKLRRVDVMIDRPGFTFNPTNCQKLSLAGSLTGTMGGSSALGTPFQVTNCRTLKFTPMFSASTSGHPSRLNGTSLTVKLTYPSAPFGTQTNVHSVKVALPKALPSRLHTLQHACTAAQFDKNPAGCPQESIVGHAIVHTDLLPDPLQGPAYFVSNGGEAFPNLIIVLQGDNVTVQLVGDTNIKNGITTSTFPATPDVPFNTFQLTLPQGPYSALTAIANPCKTSLVMPNTITAQNGAQLQQNTKIQVAGCAKAKKKARHRHRTAHKHRRHRAKGGSRG
jgi:hypothetical protein